MENSGGEAWAGHVDLAQGSAWSESIDATVDSANNCTIGTQTARPSSSTSSSNSPPPPVPTSSIPCVPPHTQAQPPKPNPRWFQSPSSVTSLKNYDARYDWLSCREFLTIVFSYLGGSVYRSKLYLMSKPSCLAAYDSKCRLQALDQLVQRLAKNDTLIFFKGSIKYLNPQEISKLINGMNEYHIEKRGTNITVKKFRPRASGGWNILRLILDEQVKVYLEGVTDNCSKHRLKSLKMCSYHASYTISQLMATQRTPHNASLLLYYSYKWYLLDVAEVVRVECFEGGQKERSKENVNFDEKRWGFTWRRLRKKVEAEMRTGKGREEVYNAIGSKLVKATVKSFAYLNRYWVKQRREKSLETMGKECFEAFGFGEMGVDGPMRRNFVKNRKEEDPMLRGDWGNTYNEQFTGGMITGGLAG
ncbi:hypothetical protein TrST_g8486 [Triparma strigata]|uniref:Uncharacterized protein n=1 Tax=Triparma strigata TaxID=1606541 RepID=A0A9W7EDL4_9STRA|nr:hypothetical protein TrST_g8486 [Triparma strigata]